jgi:hypothetical protein
VLAPILKIWQRTPNPQKPGTHRPTPKRAAHAVPNQRAHTGNGSLGRSCRLPRTLRSR